MYETAKRSSTWSKSKSIYSHFSCRVRMCASSWRDERHHAVQWNPREHSFFDRSRKNVATEVAATLNNPTQWFQRRLYWNFAWLKLGSLSGDWVFVAHCLTQTHRLSSHLANGSSKEPLPWSSHPMAYYSAFLNTHNVSTSHFDSKASFK